RMLLNDNVTPLPNQGVEILAPSGDFVHRVLTASDGTYKVEGLPPGTTSYIAHALAPGFNEQYFNGVATRPTATLLSVTNGVDTPNVNFTMTPTVAGSADLSVTMFANPSPVLSGANLTYSITASNAGPNTAANVTFTDVVPAGTTFQSITPAACATPP